MAQGQQQQEPPVYTSKSGKTYPFIWNKPGQPTDADFDAFERDVEAREASSKPPGGGGGERRPPSAEYRFINNAFEASPLNIPGMVSGLIGMASDPSRIPGALKQSLVDPVMQHGVGALREMTQGGVPTAGRSELLQALPMFGPGYSQGYDQIESGDVAGGVGTMVGNTGSLATMINPRSMVKAGTYVPRKITDWAGRSALGADTAAVRDIFGEGLMRTSPAAGARKAADLAASTRSGVQTAVTPVGGRLPPTPQPGLLSTARGFFNRTGDDLITPPPAAAPPVPRRPPPGSSGVVEPRRLPHGEAPQAAYRGLDPADVKPTAEFVQTVIDDPRFTTGSPARALDVEAAMLAKARAKPGSVKAPMRQALGSEIRTQVGHGYPSQKPALDRLGRLDQSQTVLDRAARRSPSGGVPLAGDVKYGLLPWLLKRGQGSLGQWGASGLDLADELLPPLTRAAILSQLDRDNER